MRIFYSTLLLFVIISCQAQRHSTLGDISCPSVYPSVLLPAGEESPITSRSGNHYKIPFDTVKYNHTIGNNGFNIVICLDGVINNNQIELTDNYVDSFVRKLQAIPHYAQRFKYFNIYRIGRLSNQEGSGYGFTNVGKVDNRYGTRFNAYALPRLLLPEKLDTLYADVDEFVPQWDLIMVLANDKKYGGSGWNLYDGHKVVSFSIDEEFGAGSYHLGDEVAIHEMQHVMPFAGHTYLADEYEDSYACSIYDTLPLAYKNSPNYTSDTIQNRKWQYWIDAGTPGVGYYDSAGVCPGNYRPTQLCAMRQVFNIPTPGINLGMPPFCPVCRENSTAYFDSIINPIFYNSPSPVNYTGTYTFSVQIDTPLNNTFRNQWILDDSVVATGPTSFLINFANLSNTVNHKLKFVCTDMDVVIKDTSLRRPWVVNWKLLTQDTGVNIPETVEGKELNLFPNPASNKLILIADGFQPETTAIYDANGQKVVEIKFIPEIDISLLPKGLYFVEVKYGNSSARKSFVKE